MNLHNTILMILASAVLGSSIISTAAFANDKPQHAEQQQEHNDDHENHNDEDHKEKQSDQHNEEEGHIEISIADALNAGIVNATAEAGQIKNVITVYGRAVMNPKAISQVSARFPGLITKVNVNVGDFVKAGDLIVQVESSESLKRYNINAPISGVITERHANAGELAQQQSLLTIENYDELWGQYKIFPSQRKIIQQGQQIDVLSTFAKTQSTISHFMANKNQPFINALVTIDNSDGQWTPGQMLTGNIVTAQVDVNVVIDNSALQEVEGKKVVFVTNAHGYEVREVKLGQSDEQFSQVISGLSAGEHYALINSYLLKAELGKAGASHQH